MNKIAQLKNALAKNKQNRSIIAGVVVLFAATGLYLTFTSSAAGFVVSSEAETGTVAGNAKSQADTAASGGNFIVFGTAPNGQKVIYGATGTGNPKTDDCTVNVAAGGNLATAVSGAAAGAVVCVKGDYSSTALTINKAITVRANEAVKIKSATVSGGGTMDGFMVVGSSSNGVTFSGDNNKIINNVITGHGIKIGVTCSSCGTGTIIGNNTIHNINNYGMRINGGTGIIVEKNNIYDLYDTSSSDDVDALRIWGNNSIVRTNYFHDINENKTGGPHSDCIQNYDGGGSSKGILIENNYCLRVTRQCFITQNENSSGYPVSNFTFRGNVCETFDMQALTLGNQKDDTFENNILVGASGQVICGEDFEGTGPMTNMRYNNNIYVLADSSVVVHGGRGAECTGMDGVTVDTNNITVVESFVKTDEDEHRNNTGALPASVPEDFTKWRALAAKYSSQTKDKGGPMLTPGLVTDIDGLMRIKGSAIDIGPFELDQ